MCINTFILRGRRCRREWKFNSYWLQNTSWCVEENCPRSISFPPRQGVHILNKWQKQVVEVKYKQSLFLHSLCQQTSEAGGFIFINKEEEMHSYRKSSSHFLISRSDALVWSIILWTYLVYTHSVEFLLYQFLCDSRFRGTVDSRVEFAENWKLLSSWTPLE